jgi:hypothetical protein
LKGCQVCTGVWAQCHHQGLALSRPLFLNGEVLDNGSLIVALVHSRALSDIGDTWDSFQADSLVDPVVPSSLK